MKEIKIRTPQDIIDNRANYIQEVANDIRTVLNDHFEIQFDTGVIDLECYPYANIISRRPDIFEEILKEFEQVGWQFEIVHEVDDSGTATFVGTDSKHELHFWPNANSLQKELNRT